MNHLAIYLHNDTDKRSIIDSILKNNFLTGKYSFAVGGILFNSKTIEQIIEEERRHEQFVIKTINNDSVESMSSGEQRKAVLQYFLDQQPGFIILDDWSGNLDVTNITTLQQILINAATEIQFIQLLYRRQDLLPFMQEVIVYNNNGYTIQSATSFISERSSSPAFQLHNLPYFFEWNGLQNDTLIQLNNVSVSYNDKPVLQNINWTIRPGEFWQLKGPNGSGKTTLVSIIIGDNPKAFGQDMYLFGKKKGSGESVWDIKKNIGYFYPAMVLLFKRNDTVENMIISGFVDSIGLYQAPTQLQQMTAQAWLQMLGPQYQHKRFNDLSSGQQRIVLVIRAIVKLPPLLILDEPTEGLDDDNTAIFIQLINTLAALKKTAIIYISHREEPQIKPGNIIELIKTEQGSSAKIM